MILWREKYEDFSDACREVMEAQHDTLIQYMIKDKAKFIPCMFMLKNNHGYKDKQEIDQRIAEKKQIMIVGGKEIEF